MVSSAGSGIASFITAPNQDSRMDAVIKHYGDTMMVRSSVKRLSAPILLFIAGSALIGAAFATLWLGWPWSPQDEDTHLVFLPISVAVVITIALMLTWGLLANGHRMWVSFVLISVLLMAHSILWIMSLGMLIFPIGLALFVISIARLIGMAIVESRRSP
jgi:hypothetical protein